MMAKLSIDQALMKAKSHLKKDEKIEAEKIYQVILKSFPKNFRAQQGLAYLKEIRQNNVITMPPQKLIDKLVSLYNQRQFPVVVKLAQNIVEQYPDTIVVWNILGASSAEIGMLDESIEAYKMAISLKPDYAEAYANMGCALKNQGNLDKAIEACNKAILIKPDYVEAYNNMGNALKDQGNLDKSVEVYNKALAIKPDYAEAYNNMGTALQEQGELDKAIQAYNKAISLKPDYAEAHQNLSFAFLNTGKLKEGLDEYEWRWKHSNRSSVPRYFLQPMWDGKQSLKDKKILLWSEQGIGDTINWSSCLSFISSQSEHCILECQEKLVPLLARSFPNIEVKPENKNLDRYRKDFDLHLPMGSLYKNSLEEIVQNNKPKSFLVPDPVRVRFWKERLSALGTGPYIGISWKSSNMSNKRLPNYCQISDFKPIITMPNVTIVNLQYVNFQDDLNKILQELGVLIHNFEDLDHYNNIDDVAALCSALDIVITTKTTVPLISAGTGTLTKLANWRQSPWNNILHNPVGPLIDIFERDTLEPWDNVFNSISKDLVKFKN
jgi:tetratricopeptide (TPR) repeat protein